MNKVRAILSHSNIQPFGIKKPYRIPPGVTIILLGQAGTCFFNSKKYTNLAYSTNIMKNLAALKQGKDYDMYIGSPRRARNPLQIPDYLYEMPNILINEGKYNTLLSGMYNIPLTPILPRRNNNILKFNTFAETRQAKNKSLIPIGQRSLKTQRLPPKQKNEYRLSSLIKEPGIYVVFACRAFSNNSELTLNLNKKVVVIPRGYTIRFRDAEGKLTTTKILNGVQLSKERLVNKKKELNNKKYVNKTSSFIKSGKTGRQFTMSNLGNGQYFIENLSQKINTRQFVPRTRIQSKLLNKHQILEAVSTSQLPSVVENGEEVESRQVSRPWPLPRSRTRIPLPRKVLPKPRSSSN
jgi:hypothetical protein